MGKITGRSFSTLCTMSFLSTFSFASLLPLLPVFIVDLGCTAVHAGILVSVTALANAVATTGCGMLSDAVGERVPYLLSAMCVIAGVAHFVMSLATAFTPILILRAVIGAAIGTQGVINGYLVAVTEDDERVTYMAPMQAANAAGMSLGPFMSGVIVHFGGGFSEVCKLGAALCCVAGGSAALFLQSPGEVAAKAEEEKPEGSSLSRELARPPVVIALSTMFLDALTVGMYDTVFALYCKDVIGVGTFHIAMGFASGGMLAVVSSVSVFPLSMATLGVRGTCALGCLARIVGHQVAIQTLFGHESCLVLAAIYGIFYLVVPAVSVLNSIIVPAELQGSMGGISATVIALGFMVSPLISTKLYVMNPRYSFYGANVCAALNLLLSLLLQELPATIDSSDDSSQSSHSSDSDSEDSKPRTLVRASSSLSSLGAGGVRALSVKRPKLSL